MKAGAAVAAVASSPSPADERALWQRARDGDGGARARLVVRHMPLARAIAARFGDVAPGREDLAQAAALGLVEAVTGTLFL